ncbi:MAG: T9SS type A sorting domain-containing protein [Cryomorphaceae bacterium]|nr:T9SS type A sorting domain-containing protein [Cryomorphaceae bacterium]
MKNVNKVLNVKERVNTMNSDSKYLSNGVKNINISKLLLGILFILHSFSIIAQPIRYFSHDSFVYDVLPTENKDSVWAATSEGIRLYTDNGLQSQLFNTGFQPLKIAKINNNLYFGGEDSIAVFDGSQWTYLKGNGLPQSFHVLDMAVLNNGLWLLINTQLYRMVGNSFINMMRTGNALEVGNNRLFLSNENRSEGTIGSEFFNGQWHDLSNSSTTSTVREFNSITYIGNSLFGIRSAGPGSSQVCKYIRHLDEWETIEGYGNSLGHTGDGYLYSFGNRMGLKINPQTFEVEDTLRLTHEVFFESKTEITRSTPISFNFKVRSTNGSIFFPATFQEIVSYSQHVSMPIQINKFTNSYVEWYPDLASRSFKSLSVNSLNAPLISSGIVGRDANNINHVKINGYNAMSFISPLISGEVGGQEFSRHTQGNIYSEDISFSGPISNVYDYNYVRRYDRVWKLTRAEVQNHKANYNDPNYVMPDDIRTWPGNGDYSKGEGHILAPYEDVNNNGLYEPELGDYPIIKGHEAVYVIFSDKRGSIDLMPWATLEYHLMMYAFDSTEIPALDKTVFLNYRVFNRGSSTVNNARFGLYANWSIGEIPGLSVTGSDSILQTFFGYPLDNSMQMQSYNGQPVAIAGKILNQDLLGHMIGTNAGYRLLTYGIQDEITALDFKWGDGTSLVRSSPSGLGDQNNGRGYVNSTVSSHWPTKWAFNRPDNWYEYNFNSNQTSTSIPITDLGNIEPGTHRCIEIALSHSYDSGTATPDLTTAIDNAISHVNIANDVYHDFNAGCLGVYLSNNNTLENASPNFKTYPNPVVTGREFVIESDIRITQVEIISMSGIRQSLSVHSSQNSTTVYIPKDIASGVYVVQIHNEKGSVYREKLMVVKE